MFVGKGHQHFAERQSTSQLADPQLFGRRAFGCHRLVALQTAACALDQQCAQVTIAFAADFTQHGTTALECWDGTKPSHADSCRPFLNSVALPTLATMASTARAQTTVNCCTRERTR